MHLEPRSGCNILISVSLLLPAPYFPIINTVLYLDLRPGDASAHKRWPIGCMCVGGLASVVCLVQMIANHRARRARRPHSWNVCLFVCLSGWEQRYTYDHGYGYHAVNGFIRVVWDCHPCFFVVFARRISQQTQNSPSQFCIVRVSVCRRTLMLLPSGSLALHFY